MKHTNIPPRILAEATPEEAEGATAIELARSKSPLPKEKTADSPATAHGATKMPDTKNGRSPLGLSYEPSGT